MRVDETQRRLMVDIGQNVRQLLAATFKYDQPVPQSGGSQRDTDKSQKILAIYSPYPNAGKTSAARWMVHRWAFFGQVVSFAEPLKEIVHSLCQRASLPLFFNYQTMKSEPFQDFKNQTPRDLMCLIGNTLRGAYGQDLFARLVRYEILQMPEIDIVIDDLRLPEEYDMLKDLGAKFMRIDVEGRKATEHPAVETESRLNDREFDVVVHNKMNGKSAFYEALTEAVLSLWPR